MIQYTTESKVYHSWNTEGEITEVRGHVWRQLRALLSVTCASRNTPLGFSNLVWSSSLSKLSPLFSFPFLSERLGAETSALFLIHLPPLRTHQLSQLLSLPIWARAAVKTEVRRGQDRSLINKEGSADSTELGRKQTETWASICIEKKQWMSQRREASWSKQGENDVWP